MAEALIREDVRERTLTERMVVGMRMAQAEKWEPADLPDVDEAMRLFYEWLEGDLERDDGLSDEERSLRVALGLRR